MSLHPDDPRVRLFREASRWHPAGEARTESGSASEDVSGRPTGTAAPVVCTTIVGPWRLWRALAALDREPAPEPAGEG